MAPGGRFAGDNFEFRRKAQHVFVDKDSGDVVLRLHETNIVRVSPAGDVTLCTGGWATHKTMQSMNDALRHFHMSVECEYASPPQGRWQVCDDDGTLHRYYTDKNDFTTTIRAKPNSTDSKRAKWLADAYNVPYAPPPTRASAASGPRVASLQPAAGAAQVLHAPPAPHRANGAPAAPAAAPASTVPSWAARTSGSAVTTAGVCMIALVCWCMCGPCVRS
jgi:hypothetical protein